MGISQLHWTIGMIAVASGLTLPSSSPVSAQTSASSTTASLESRIATVRSGSVRFSYPAKEGVCGNGRGNISVRSADEHVGAGARRSSEWENECEPGPVRISLDKSGGRVTALRAYVGGRWRGTADADLGSVGAAEASAFLIGLAEREEGSVAKEAIFPAVIAEGVTLWPRLLSLAKNGERPRSVRDNAVFWVSQAAGEAATRGLQEIVDSADGDREIRKSAIFALSQRPNDESVPALIRIARTQKDPELRRAAVFWLGQSKDARALRYFEEVLLGKD